MNRIFAISGRILSQFAHDRRTLALLFVAPIVVLWLLSVLLGASTYIPTVAAVDLPGEYREVLESQDVHIKDMDRDKAEKLLRDDELDAVLYMEDEGAVLHVYSEGSNMSEKTAVARVVSESFNKLSEQAKKNMPKGMGAAVPIGDIKTTYLHGDDDWEMFDYYGPVFIGIFIFAFTFITSGMSLVNERSAGTMTRFLATPVKSWEILGGYSIGFGILSFVQVAVVITAALKLIGFPNEGNVIWVVCIAVSLAVASVTLGLLVSGLATNAFQVVQLMLLFVLPQILLSGIFDLSAAPEWLKVISECLPLTYGVDAMQQVMLRGAGIDVIWVDILIVWGFIVGFFVLAAIGFRKKRVREREAA